VAVPTLLLLVKPGWTVLPLSRLNVLRAATFDLVCESMPWLQFAMECLHMAEFVHTAQLFFNSLGMLLVQFE